MLEKVKKTYRAFRIYYDDFRRDMKYSTLLTGYNTQEKVLSRLVVEAHTIEKGLTMPEKKPVFGREKVLTIIGLCENYLRMSYDKTDPRFVYVLGILNEYKGYHQGIADMKDVTLKIDNLTSKVNGGKIEDIRQTYSIRSEDYFADKNSPFDIFARSRHSCRNLSEPVDEVTLWKALDLSMTAPSTCNRQSHRVHILQSDDAKQKILEIQSGNRGFGHLVDKFILVTSDLSDWPGGHQRNAPYVDGGIYVMNLLYSLHQYGIAACTLNLYLDVNRTQKLHQNLDIPENEVPIALIAVGKTPDKVDIALSKRRDIREVVKTH